MTLQRIRLELARTKDHPEGSPLHGYDFVAPLDPEGRLDKVDWKTHAKACTVRRFSEGEPDEYGQLVHSRHGWVFSYAPGEDDDEPIFKFDRHVFREGEYVSITEHDGETLPFRIVSIRRAPV